MVACSLLKYRQSVWLRSVKRGNALISASERRRRGNLEWCGLCGGCQDSAAKAKNLTVSHVRGVFVLIETSSELGFHHCMHVYLTA